MYTHAHTVKKFHKTTENAKWGNMELVLYFICFCVTADICDSPQIYFLGMITSVTAKCFVLIPISYLRLETGCADRFLVGYCFKQGFLPPNVLLCTLEFSYMIGIAYCHAMETFPTCPYCILMLNDWLFWLIGSSVKMNFSLTFPVELRVFMLSHSTIYKFFLFVYCQPL